MSVEDDDNIVMVNKSNFGLPVPYFLVKLIFLLLFVDFLSGLLAHSASNSAYSANAW